MYPYPVSFDRKSYNALACGKLLAGVGNNCCLLLAWHWLMTECDDWRDCCCCCCCWCICRIIFVSSFGRGEWKFPNDFALFVWLFNWHWPSAILLWFSDVGCSGCCVNVVVVVTFVDDDNDSSCCSNGLLLSFADWVADIELELLIWFWYADVAFFMPSKSRISNTFGGKSSTFISTKTRHSGHRSSEWLDTITLYKKNIFFKLIFNSITTWRMNGAKLPLNIFGRMCVGREALWTSCQAVPSKWNTRADRLAYFRPFYVRKPLVRFSVYLYLSLYLFRISHWFSRNS